MDNLQRLTIEVQKIVEKAPDLFDALSKDEIIIKTKN